MSDLNINVSVADDLRLPLAQQELEDAVRWVLEGEGVREAEVSVTLVGDAEISALNEEHLDHPGPTDVISFPLGIPGAQVVGDIYIGAEQAARQAQELGVSAREELLRLCVHGTLHVLGYEHPEGEGREQSSMYLRQEELLREFLQRREAL